MREVACLLAGLTCSTCLTEDSLWADLVAGVVECRTCGQAALLHPADTIGEAR